MSAYTDLKLKAESLGIEFKANISMAELTELVNDHVPVEVLDQENEPEVDPEPTPDDQEPVDMVNLKDKADDLGITYPSNVTAELLISKIAEAEEENEKDDKGTYVVCGTEYNVIILPGVEVKKGVPFMIDDFMGNERFMFKVKHYIKSGLLKEIK